ncbi:condensation domain-containing protein, partial [Nocardia gipuzkoensis]
MLAGLPEESTLPSDRSRPAIQSFRGGSIDVAVEAEVCRGLRRLAGAERATLFMVVHSALAVLLGRLSGRNDVAIGVPVAGRGAAELDDMIGMFVNTVVLRTRLDAAESFTDLLVRQRDIDLSAFAHADLPFERLVTVLAPERSTERTPLFQVALAFQNMPTGSVELPGLRLTPLEADAHVERFDLSLFITEADEALRIRWSYAADLFDE